MIPHMTALADEGPFGEVTLAEETVLYGGGVGGDEEKVALLYAIFFAVIAADIVTVGERSVAVAVVRSRVSLVLQATQNRWKAVP